MDPFSQILFIFLSKRYQFMQIYFMGKEPTKTKPIKKSNKQTKQRTIQSENLGRPKNRNNEFQIPLDPCQELYEIILDYLKKIGLPHGLVFRKEDRRQFKDKEEKPEQKGDIKWNEGHKWILEQEKSKIRNQRQKLKDQNEDGFRFREKLIGLNKIEEFYIKLGGLFADEFTEQFYSVLTSVLQSIDKNEEEALSILRECMGRCQFMNGEYFRKRKLNIKYYLDIKKGEKEISRQFLNMLIEMRTQLFGLLKEMI